MKFLKKLAVLTAAVAVISAQSAVFAFDDMPDGEIGEALQNAVDNGLINGLDDNTIAPDNLITRAEMAAIITRAFGAVEEAEISFPDVADDAWYVNDVKKAVAMSAFEGDENGNFNPTNNITFQETYTVLSRVFYLEPYTITKSDGTKETLYEVDDSALASFSDKDEVADWASVYAQSIVKNGGWDGIDGELRPTDNLTRGEFALIMYKLVTTYIDEPGTYDALPDGLTMVRTGGVEIKNLKTDKNLILSYGIDEEGCTVTDSDINGATIVLGGANPVEKTDEETGKTTLVPGDSAYISLSGHFYDIRLKSPYVVVSVPYDAFDHCWTDTNTKALLGTISME